MTLYTKLVEMGWQPVRGGDMPAMKFLLFGLTVQRVFHMDELQRTGDQAEDMARYFTEKAMFELVSMMYDALYSYHGKRGPNDKQLPEKNI